MAVEVLMPKLGATMEKGTIIEWLKDEGDFVQIGEPILEIMTDKINIEVEATNEGVLLKKLFEKDAEVPVLEAIAYIGQSGEVIADRTDKKQEPLEGQNRSQPTSSISESPKIRRTPAARKLARENGVDLSKITGSGIHNRIHVQDVEKFMKAERSMTPLAEKILKEMDVPSNTKLNKEAVINAIPRKIKRSIQYNGIRKTIGERMTESIQTAPHVTLNTIVDMTKVLELREQIQEKVMKKTGFRLSITDMIVKCTAKALESHPMVNASLNGDQIDLHSDINIGIAVSVPNGLIVPVITNAHQKGLAEITEESKNVIKKARENRLTSEQLQGGTFTISNLGMYAIDSFTPIINQPQSAILGVGRITEQVVSVNGNIEVRPQMSLSLSFDHRIVDGAPAAHFLTDLKIILENPYELLI